MNILDEAIEYYNNEDYEPYEAHRKFLDAYYQGFIGATYYIGLVYDNENIQINYKELERILIDGYKHRIEDSSYYLEKLFSDPHNPDKHLFYAIYYAIIDKNITTKSYETIIKQLVSYLNELKYSCGREVDIIDKAHELKNKYSFDGKLTNIFNQIIERNRNINTQFYIYNFGLYCKYKNNISSLNQMSNYLYVDRVAKEYCKRLLDDYIKEFETQSDIESFISKVNLLEAKYKTDSNKKILKAIMDNYIVINKASLEEKTKRALAIRGMFCENLESDYFDLVKPLVERYIELLFENKETNSALSIAKEFDNELYNKLIDRVKDKELRDKADSGDIDSIIKYFMKINGATNERIYIENAFNKYKDPRLFCLYSSLINRVYGKSKYEDFILEHKNYINENNEELDYFAMEIVTIEKERKLEQEKRERCSKYGIESCYKYGKTVYYSKPYYSKATVEEYPNNSEYKDSYYSFIHLKNGRVNSKDYDFKTIVLAALEQLCEKAYGEVLVCFVPGSSDVYQNTNSLINIINNLGNKMPKNLHIYNDLIIRKYAVKKKHLLTPDERFDSSYREKCKDSFMVQNTYMNDIAKYEYCIIVDDIVTTGETIYDCGTLLEKNIDTVLYYAVGLTKYGKE